jgi:hypothetical protein
VTQLKKLGEGIAGIVICKFKPKHGTISLTQLFSGPVFFRTINA